MSSNPRPALDQAFAQALEDKIFTGAQLAFGFQDKNHELLEYGHLADPDSPAVHRGSLFDLASLTKPLVTGLLYLQLFDEKQITLRETVRHYLPHFRGDPEITLHDLLSHRSGLPAWAPLYEGISVDEGREAVQRHYLNAISQIAPAAGRGEKRIYSDLGFLLLGWILEAIAGQPLEAMFQERIADPWQLRRTLYNPLRKFPPQDCAATELCPWRERRLQGEVHDDNAWTLGGAAGHAGLFGNAEDVEQMLWRIQAMARGEGAISAASFRVFFDEKLAWDSVTPPYSQAGKYFSARSSMGHLAFTGCSLWMDFKDGKYLILLTNRTYFGREDSRIKRLRPWIHDLAFSPS